MTAVASIVIPAYNHASVVLDAVSSALAQTVPCEVVVVDDGSTDATPAILKRYATDARVRVIRVPHGGPARARNVGLEAARAPYVMFLDADDLIAPTKVERQVRCFEAHPDVEWVYCDVTIHDERRGAKTTASERYAYAARPLTGWLHAQMAEGNFIPIMAPLVRRASIPDWLRFDEQKFPEDWHFWCGIASILRAQYVPEVLATYRRTRSGRHTLPAAARKVYPTFTHPLRLNLGCGQPDKPSWHPIPGMVNLDKSLGWTFEEGLRDFADHTVAAITISHALMFLAEQDWPAFFSEVSRVLVEGGVVRVTEDETDDPRSRRKGGWKGSEPFVTLTTPMFVKQHMARAGLLTYEVTKDTTHFTDRSVCQAHHGDAPDVFFVEGVKMRGTLFAPHNDDECLFAAFTVLRYRPRVVVCFPSVDDYGDSAVREQETRAAMGMLGAGPIEQWDGHDLEQRMLDFDERVHPVQVWAPSAETSHPDHLAVCQAADVVFGDRVTHYQTYQDGQKVRLGQVVPFEPVWVGQKLRALSCYQSQITHERANQFFCQDLYEYVVPK